MTRLSIDSADLIHERHSEWLDGFKAGALLTALLTGIGIMIVGWLA